MSTEPNNPIKTLLHVHVCPNCKSAFRREDFEDRAHTTGIYLCPKCGVESPLNIEIQPIDAQQRG